MTARPHGTGSLFEKHGAWYGRWRAPDGRRLSRKLGPVDAIGRREAERRLRALMVSEASAPSPPPEARRHTVDEAAEALIEHKRVQGVSRSYRDAHEAVGFLLSYWRSILEGETPSREFEKVSEEVQSAVSRFFETTAGYVGPDRAVVRTKRRRRGTDSR